jgi:hypothetical protein
MGINIKALADGSTGLEGTDLNNGDFVYVNIPYTASSPLTMSGAIFNRKMVVHSVTLNTDVASTNAVTVQVFAAPSATALGSGTAQLSAQLSLQTTAGTNAVGSLSATAGAANVASGSRVGVVISGALGASGSGVVTIALGVA